MNLRTIFASLLIVFTFNSWAEKADSCLYVQVDLANRWIWRAAAFSEAPVIQPSIGYQGKKLSASIWGSYAFESRAYSEIDFTIEYQLFTKFRLGLIDYFTTSDVTGAEHRFFNFDERTSSHMLELYGNHKPFNKTPLAFLYSVWFWGPDRDKGTQKQYYSTYFEAKYTKSLEQVDAYAFAGMTPWKGFYATGPALVNVGLGLSKSITIGDRVSIPAKIEFILNPDAQKAFINAIISIR